MRSTSDHDQQPERPGNHSGPPPVDIYHQAAADYQHTLQLLAQRQNRFSNLRLLAGGLTLAAAIWLGVSRSIPAMVALAAAVAVFAWFVYRHRIVSKARLRAQIMANINQEAIARIDRRWEDIPLHRSDVDTSDHPFANDLDILGHASLAHLVDATTTRMGRDRLESWLLSPACVTEIVQRQSAVRELAPLLAWRQQLQLLGRLDRTNRRDPEPFLQWAEGPPMLGNRRFLCWLARAGALLTFLTIVLSIGRVIPPAFIALPLLANLGLSLVASRTIGDRIEIARNQHPAMEAFSRILEHLDTQPFASPRLADLQTALGAHDRPAHVEVRRLGRITSFAVPKSALSHIALQALGNWDIHLLEALERWQHDNGAHVRSWLAIIGDFEALSSLAGLAFDNPGWAYPKVAEDIETLEAASLGHPFLAEPERVCNAIAVGPSGTFLFVTGSNMSGKSTLLRAIGVNAVLALAGGQCCAAALAMPPVALWTSMRVSDSLERGISYYMAELIRLKTIHDAAEGAHKEGKPFCYLLDEMLQGTNSAERQIAARRIVASLVELGAIGAVTTHDLQLADAPELAAIAVPVHFSDVFTESPDGLQMSFDYILRDGIATSTNALKLMQLVGFETR